jgi:capsular exopolysaccharide synthesis family protein
MQAKKLNSSISETFGETADTLLFTTQNQTQQRWLITSALAGEGKTLSAIGLASTMARRNKKVLLIDANLRNPTITQRYSFAAQGGLIEILLQGLKLKDALHQDDEIENLFVLGAGNRDTEPFELFNGERMRVFLDKIQSLFDFIIIDVPAFANALDALLLVPHVEGCIMVVQAERTGKSAVLKARQQIEEAGGKILGLIFNREKQHIPNIFHRS